MFLASASRFNEVYGRQNLSFLDSILEAKKWMYTHLFGIWINPKEIFETVHRSYDLQTKWFLEHTGRKSEDLIEILTTQIEHFDPDVIYTSDINLIKDYAVSLRSSRAKIALWVASHVPLWKRLNRYDMVLTYSNVFEQHLRSRGASNIVITNFWVQGDLKHNCAQLEVKNRCDISFCGTYNKRFKTRNSLLRDILCTFSKDVDVKLYLSSNRKTDRSFQSLQIDFKNFVHDPVYGKKLFEVFNNTKFNLNYHSDITGIEKGNMRLFEVLGSGNLLITDQGNYHPAFRPDHDFITYTNAEDLRKKVLMLLNEPEYCNYISNNGYETVQSHFGPKKAKSHLLETFSKL